MSVLEADGGTARTNAAAALGNLAHAHAENRERIGRTPRALASLVAALLAGWAPGASPGGGGPAAEECRRNACAALANLTEDHAANRALVGALPGAVAGLVRLLCGARAASRFAPVAALRPAVLRPAASFAATRHSLFLPLFCDAAIPPTPPPLFRL